MTEAPAKRTVLVVDDEKAARDIMGDMLAHAGYEVMFAAHGAEALPIVARYRIDFIVMDMLMPVMDGLTATRRLKSDPVTARIPILALTGDPGAALREETIAAGCDTYLTKPVNPMSLISLVKHWLQR